MKFPLFNPDHWKELSRRSSPYFTRPIEVSHFSIDNCGTFLPDKSQLKRYLPDPDLIPLYGDLAHNISNYVPKPSLNEPQLDDILTSIQKCNILLDHVDIITWRGIMTKILCSPFDSRSEWTMHGIYRNGIIYLGEKRKPEVINSQNQVIASYGGFKFESLTMVPANIPSDQIPPLADRQLVPVNAIGYFGIVYKACLGEHSLLLSAEMDGLDEDGQDYLELKTQKIIFNERERLFFFRDKLLKFWIQSYLAGTGKLLIGWRNESFHLVKLENFLNSSIPGIVMENGFQWYGDGMIVFGEKFFDWLKSIILNLKRSKEIKEQEGRKENEEEEIHFILTRKIESKDIEFELSKKRHSFIPDWYDSDQNRND